MAKLCMRPHRLNVYDEWCESQITPIQTLLRKVGRPRVQ